MKQNRVLAILFIFAVLFVASLLSTSAGAAAWAVTTNNTIPDKLARILIRGNSAVTSDKDYDAGDLVSGDGCSSACAVESGTSCIGSLIVFMPESVCGDGTVEIGEDCDDSNLIDGDGCSSACAVESGYSCSGSPSVCTSACGDGAVASNEDCDDSNLIDGDGCSSTCTVESGYSCIGSPSVCTRTAITLTLTSVGTYDGHILESGENTTAGGTLDSTSPTFYLGDDAGDKQYRAILSFDTSALPNNAVITRVILKLRKQGQQGADPFTILGGLKVDIRKSFFGTGLGLVASDFQATASRSGVGTFKSTPKNNWYFAVIGSTGYPYISLNGTTQFRLLFLLGDNDNGVADYMRFFSGNYSNAAARPTLVIEYYIP
jgi:cysteine-rich repeat protein